MTKKNKIKKKQINLFISPDLIRELRMDAAMQGSRPSTVVADIIEKYLEKKKKDTGSN
jgi:hypothetical protein